MLTGYYLYRNNATIYFKNGQCHTETTTNTVVTAVYKVKPDMCYEICQYINCFCCRRLETYVNITNTSIFPLYNIQFDYKSINSSVKKISFKQSSDICEYEETDDLVKIKLDKLDSGKSFWFKISGNLKSKLMATEQIALLNYRAEFYAPDGDRIFIGENRPLIYTDS